MTIKYFDLYSLNFSNLDRFLASLDTIQDESLKLEFLEARSREQVVTKTFNKEQAAFDIMGGELKENWIQTRIISEKMFAEFQGADPYDIQDCVNIILGISGAEKRPSMEITQQYFTMMKESGFLACNQGLFDVELKYQPGILAAKFLTENPHITTLTIGCGKAVKYYYSSCYFRKPEEHVHDSFDIDMTAGIGPDLVVDMHNLDFWRAIPGQYFENIQDHTYSHALFESKTSELTVQEIFRTLKPGSFLTMDHAFNKEQITLLENVGFSVSYWGNQKKAQKPSKENCTIS